MGWKQPTYSDSSSDSWMMSYADVVTSLLAFFVLLMSISSIDQRKIEYIQESLQTDVLKQDYEKPFDTLKDDLETMVSDHQLSEDINVQAGPMGLDITFSSSVLYRSGSAEVQQTMSPFLSEVSQLIKDFKYENILIETYFFYDD